eukprot:g14934.t1
MPGVSATSPVQPLPEPLLFDPPAQGQTLTSYLREQKELLKLHVNDRTEELFDTFSNAQRKAMEPVLAKLSTALAVQQWEPGGSVAAGKSLSTHPATVIPAESADLEQCTDCAALKTEGECATEKKKCRWGPPPGATASGEGDEAEAAAAAAAAAKVTISAATSDHDEPACFSKSGSSENKDFCAALTTKGECLEKDEMCSWGDGTSSKAGVAPIAGAETEQNAGAQDSEQPEGEGEQLSKKSGAAGAAKVAKVKEESPKEGKGEAEAKSPFPKVCTSKTPALQRVCAKQRSNDDCLAETKLRCHWERQRATQGAGTTGPAAEATSDHDVAGADKEQKQGDQEKRNVCVALDPTDESDVAACGEISEKIQCNEQLTKACKWDDWEPKSGCLALDSTNKTQKATCFDAKDEKSCGALTKADLPAEDETAGKVGEKGVAGTEEGSSTSVSDAEAGGDAPAPDASTTSEEVTPGAKPATTAADGEDGEKTKEVAEEEKICIWVPHPIQKCLSKKFEDSEFCGKIEARDDCEYEDSKCHWVSITFRGKNAHEDAAAPKPLSVVADAPQGQEQATTAPDNVAASTFAEVDANGEEPEIGDSAAAAAAATTTPGAGAGTLGGSQQGAGVAAESPSSSVPPLFQDKIQPARPDGMDVLPPPADPGFRTSEFDANMRVAEKAKEAGAAAAQAQLEKEAAAARNAAKEAEEAASPTGVCHPLRPDDTQNVEFCNGQKSKAACSPEECAWSAGEPKNADEPGEPLQPGAGGHHLCKPAPDKLAAAIASDKEHGVEQIGALCSKLTTQSACIGAQDMQCSWLADEQQKGGAPASGAAVAAAAAGSAAGAASVSGAASTGSLLLSGQSITDLQEPPAKFSYPRCRARDLRILGDASACMVHPNAEICEADVACQWWKPAGINPQTGLPDDTVDAAALLANEEDTSGVCEIDPALPSLKPEARAEAQEVAERMKRLGITVSLPSTDEELSVPARIALVCAALKKKASCDGNEICQWRTIDRGPEAETWRCSVMRDALDPLPIGASVHEVLARYSKDLTEGLHDLAKITDCGLKKLEENTHKLLAEESPAMMRKISDIARLDMKTRLNDWYSRSKKTLDPSSKNFATEVGSLRDLWQRRKAWVDTVLGEKIDRDNDVRMKKFDELTRRALQQTEVSTFIGKMGERSLPDALEDVVKKAQRRMELLEKMKIEESSKAEQGGARPKVLAEGEADAHEGKKQDEKGGDTDFTSFASRRRARSRRSTAAAGHVDLMGKIRETLAEGDEAAEGAGAADEGEGGDHAGAAAARGPGKEPSATNGEDEQKFVSSAEKQRRRAALRRQKEAAQVAAREQMARKLAVTEFSAHRASGKDKELVCSEEIHEKLLQAEGENIDTAGTTDAGAEGEEGGGAEEGAANAGDASGGAASEKKDAAALGSERQEQGDKDEQESVDESNKAPAPKAKSDLDALDPAMKPSPHPPKPKMKPRRVKRAPLTEDLILGPQVEARWRRLDDWKLDLNFQGKCGVDIALKERASVPTEAPRENFAGVVDQPPKMMECAPRHEGERYYQDQIECDKVGLAPHCDLKCQEKMCNEDKGATCEWKEAKGASVLEPPALGRCYPTKKAIETIHTEYLVRHGGECKALAPQEPESAADGAGGTGEGDADVEDKKDAAAAGGGSAAAKEVEKEAAAAQALTKSPAQLEREAAEAEQTCRAIINAESCNGKLGKTEQQLCLWEPLKPPAAAGICAAKDPTNTDASTACAAHAGNEAACVAGDTANGLCEWKPPTLGTCEALNPEDEAQVATCSTKPNQGSCETSTNMCKWKAKAANAADASTTQDQDGGFCAAKSAEFGEICGSLNDIKDACVTEQETCTWKTGGVCLATDPTNSDDMQDCLALSTRKMCEKGTAAMNLEGEDVEDDLSSAAAGGASTSSSSAAVTEAPKCGWKAFARSVDEKKAAQAANAAGGDGESTSSSTTTSTNTGEQVNAEVGAGAGTTTATSSTPEFSKKCFAKDPTSATESDLAACEGLATEDDCNADARCEFKVQQSATATAQLGICLPDAHRVKQQSGEDGGGTISKGMVENCRARADATACINGGEQHALGAGAEEAEAALCKWQPLVLKRPPGGCSAKNLFSKTSGDEAEISGGEVVEAADNVSSEDIAFCLSKNTAVDCDKDRCEWTEPPPASGACVGNRPDTFDKCGVVIGGDLSLAADEVEDSSEVMAQACGKQHEHSNFECGFVKFQNPGGDCVALKQGDEEATAVCAEKLTQVKCVGSTLATTNDTCRWVQKEKPDGVCLAADLANETDRAACGAATDQASCGPPEQCGWVAFETAVKKPREIPEEEKLLALERKCKNLRDGGPETCTEPEDCRWEPKPPEYTCKSLKALEAYGEEMDALKTKKVVTKILALGEVGATEGEAGAASEAASRAVKSIKDTAGVRRLRTKPRERRGMRRLAELTQKLHLQERKALKVMKLKVKKARPPRRTLKIRLHSSLTRKTGKTSATTCST